MEDECQLSGVRGMYSMYVLASPGCYVCALLVCVCSVSVVTVNRLVDVGTVPHMTSFVVKCCIPHTTYRTVGRNYFILSICVHASQVFVSMLHK